MTKIFHYLKKIIFSDRFTFIIRLTLIVALIAAVFQQAWLNIFISSLSLVLTFSHRALEKYDIILPQEFQVFIIFFVYASMFLGEIQNFYSRFSWWDSLLHGMSGIALGFIGFLILYIFYKTKKFKAPIILISIFSFCFALSLGALWEIFEYSVDEFLGANMQKARGLEEVYGYFDTRLGIQDTMHDLIVDSLGALFASTTGYVYLKKGESFKWFDALVTSFEKVNHKLFK